MIFLGCGPSYLHHTSHSHPSTPTAPRPLLTENLNMPLSFWLMNGVRQQLIIVVGAQTDDDDDDDDDDDEVMIRLQAIALDVPQ